MKIFFTLLTVSIAINSLWAQSTISGQILDHKKEAIAGANVFLQGTVRAVQSDENGNYILKNLNAGAYTLQISMVGYTKIAHEILAEGKKNCY